MYELKKYFTTEFCGFADDFYVIIRTDKIRQVNFMEIMEKIEVNPKIKHGKPVISGTRIPVYMVV